MEKAFTYIPNRPMLKCGHCEGDIEACSSCNSSFLDDEMIFCDCVYPVNGKPDRHLCEECYNTEEQKIMKKKR